MTNLTHSIALLHKAMTTAETVDERLDYARGLGLLKAINDAPMGLTLTQGVER